MSWVLLLLVLLLSLNLVGSTENDSVTFRLLLLGDSVDRYAVMDWCKNYNGTLVDDKHRGGKYDLLLRKHGNRRKSWELRICDAQASRNIIVTQLSNKFGVKSNPPWHCPIATTAGLVSTNFTGLADTIRTGIFPGLDILEQMTGGKPNAVLLNSVFWDLSHPDPDNHRIGSPDLWLSSWYRNVTEFIGIVKQRFDADNKVGSESKCMTTWYGWRTGTRMSIVPPGHHWNTLHAHNLMLKMNQWIKDESTQLGVEVIDVYSSNTQLKDHLHPAFPVSVGIVESAVQHGLKSLHALGCSKFNAD